VSSRPAPPTRPARHPCPPSLWRGPPRNLPDDFRSLREIMIEKDALPTVKERVGKVKSSPEHAYFLAAHPKRKMCFNRDSHLHHTRDCKEKKLDCDICVQEAGHMARYCLIKSEKPIPSSIQGEARARLEKKRKELAAQKESAMLNVPKDDEEDFLEPSQEDG
ncbi:MAG: hypothetical protein SGPRY_007109, partial [Prymnesium sp.]